MFPGSQDRSLPKQGCEELKQKAPKCQINISLQHLEIQKP